MEEDERMAREFMDNNIEQNNTNPKDYDDDLVAKIIQMELDEKLAKEYIIRFLFFTL